MRPYVLTLAVLFIAFTIPSDAQTSEAPVSSAAPAGAAPAGAGVADIYEDYPKTLVTYELGSELVFNCTPSEPASATFSWQKNGTALEQVQSLARRHALEAGGAVLRLAHAYEADHGNYTCLAGGVWARGWQAVSRLLAKLPADTNVVEGQKLSLTCRLLGKPYARVSWARVEPGGNLSALGEGGDARFTARDSPAGVPGGVLELPAAAAADAGNYSCAPPGGHAAFTVVRVKDVYAALWPFLGICLEVFVLCAIILVYEKRRTKPELDDSDADTHDQ